MQKNKINQTNVNQRLDIVVGMYLQGMSRTSIRNLIKQGKILVNGHNQKAAYKLKELDVITIDYDESRQNIETILELPIIYEDDDCIVIDKPIGLLTHNKGNFNPESTIASFIAPKITNLEGDRAGIVHRLDRATSGVMICAKNPDAQKWLQKQFTQRKVKKTYVAIIKTGLQPIEAIIDMSIERNPHSPKQFRVGNNGKSAQTHYKILKSSDTYDLIELKPVTGRTHQLRVHLKQLGFPIVGDELYGGENHKRLMLHSKSLEITLPNRQRSTFNSVLPSEFNVLCLTLEKPSTLGRAKQA